MQEEIVIMNLWNIHFFQHNRIIKQEIHPSGHPGWYSDASQRSREAIVSYLGAECRAFRTKYHSVAGQMDIC